MALHDHPTRSDTEIRSLLHLLTAAEGICPDAGLRRELRDTGFVRVDRDREDVLHLTPEGRRFLHA